MDRVENYLHVTTTNYDTINRLLHHGPDKVQLMVDGPVPNNNIRERANNVHGLFFDSWVDFRKSG